MVKKQELLQMEEKLTSLLHQEPIQCMDAIKKEPFLLYYL